MKKIILNISETTFEKFRFEAISESRSIQEIIVARLLYKPFDQEIDEAFNEWLEKEIEKVFKE